MTDQPKHYTDEDVKRAARALVPFFGDGIVASPEEHSDRMAYAFLNAVAPAIAARALREFAAEWTKWVASDAPQTRGGAAYRARVRADQIEAGR